MTPIHPPTDGLFQWPRWVFLSPQATALVFIDQHEGIARLSWAELTHAVGSLADGLVRLGWRAGDRLVHHCGNSLEGVLVALASPAIGTIEVPLEPTIQARRFQAVVDWVGGKTLHAADVRAIVQSSVASDVPDHDRAADLLSRQATLADDQPALILLTSGSTGNPKAVTLSRRNLAVNAAAKLAAVPQVRDDVRLTLLPICHAYARTCDLGTWLISGSQLAIDSGWAGWQRLARLVCPSLVNTVPSLAQRILELPVDRPELSRLRLVGCGGAALGSDVFTQFQQRRITVIQGYGMTETSPVICSATPQNARAGYVGAPVAGWQTRIDCEGRLAVRGPAVMIGYWNDDVATSQRCVDGWLDTGDIVEVDPQDGQFRIVGRADDRLTLANGRKLYPLAIQQQVMAIPQVRHAILIAAGRHTELWIDLADSQTQELAVWAERIGRQLREFPPWQVPRRLCLFPQSLAEIPGMLTVKATPVRQRVLDLIASWRTDATIVVRSIDVARR